MEEDYPILIYLAFNDETKNHYAVFLDEEAFVEYIKQHPHAGIALRQIRIGIHGTNKRQEQVA